MDRCVEGPILNSKFPILNSDGMCVAMERARREARALSKKNRSDG
jgi:hypothetical protein